MRAGVLECFVVVVVPSLQMNELNDQDDPPSDEEAGENDRLLMSPDDQSRHVIRQGVCESLYQSLCSVFQGILFVVGWFLHDSFNSYMCGWFLCWLFMCVSAAYNISLQACSQLSLMGSLCMHVNIIPADLCLCNVIFTIACCVVMTIAFKNYNRLYIRIRSTRAREEDADFSAQIES